MSHLFAAFVFLPKSVNQTNVRHLLWHSLKSIDPITASSPIHMKSAACQTNSDSPPVCPAKLSVSRPNCCNIVTNTFVRG